MRLAPLLLVAAWGCSGGGDTPSGEPEPLSVNGGSACLASERHGLVSCWGEGYGPRPMAIGGIEADQVAAGRGFGCALPQDEVPVCWGANDRGQLGRGETSEEPLGPAPVPGVTGATRIAAGSAHACALTGDGQLWCWGGSDAGLQGEADLPSPVRIAEDTVHVAAAGTRTCALDRRGTPTCWGGDTPLPIPTDQTGLTTLVVAPDYACGHAQGWACWGEGAPPAPPETMRQVTAGDGYLCGVDEDRAVWCWGSNGLGQLGNGSTTPADAPQLVASLANTAFVAAGGQLTCAMQMGERVSCWGDNRRGQVGDGKGSAPTESPYPVDVVGLTDVDHAAAGASHTCAVDGDGAVWCWGDSGHGALGTGDGGPAVPTAPTRAEVSDAAVQIVASGRHTCARLADGTVECWGDRGAGPVFTPTAQSLPEVRDVDASSTHVCGVAAAGEVVCTPSTRATLRGSDVSVGDFGVCARGADGVQCLDTRRPDAQPITVALEGKVTAIAVGGTHACAVVDNTPWCWGANDRGQAGQAQGAVIPKPKRVSGVVGVQDITAGLTHTCAVVRGGEVYCWGDRGQWRTGASKADRRSNCVEGQKCYKPFRYRPHRVAPMGGAVSITAGLAHTCVTDDDGRMRCWGDNGAGQLGLGGGAARLEPYTVAHRW